MRIRGYVQDNFGTALANVNIYVKDQPYIGTASSSTGYFDLEVEVGKTLVFSHQGYRLQHAEVKEQYPVMNVTLNEAVTELEGTTVTASNSGSGTTSSNSGSGTTTSKSYNDAIKKSKTWLIISGVGLLVAVAFGIYHFSKTPPKKVEL